MPARATQAVKPASRAENRVERPSGHIIADDPRAEPRLVHHLTRTGPLLSPYQDSPREDANGAFNNTHVGVRHHRPEARITQERLYEGQHDRVVGAQNFPHCDAASSPKEDALLYGRASITLWCPVCGETEAIALRAKNCALDESGSRWRGRIKKADLGVRASPREP